MVREWNDVGLREVSWSTFASGETGIVQVISSNASCSLEEMVDVKLPDQTLMWQYYVAADRVRAEKSLRKALDLGMQSIWVTVDAPVVSRARWSSSP